MKAKISSVIHDDTKYQKGMLHMRTQKCFAVKVGFLFSPVRMSYTLIFLCKDINLKILVIQVRHTCILPEHNKFVHKDNRALSEIYKDDKMITNLFAERILFLLQGSINGKVCTLMHIGFQIYFNYFSSLVLNTIH